MQINKSILYIKPHLKQRTPLLVLEYVGPKWRTFVANMSIALFFTFAACVLPWIAYFLADWRMTCIAISVPLALAIAAPWLVPESARWLVSQNRVEKAIEILGKFERINGTKVPENVYQQFRVRVSNFVYFFCIYPCFFLKKIFRRVYR